MSETPLLEFRRVGKAFGDNWAHRDISFAVRKGTIHALVGENGAGKSTLMKVLFGLEFADEGEILLRGQPLTLHSPAEARRHGFGMVQQHFALAGPLPALDHVFLDDPSPPFWQALPRRQRLQEMQTLSRQFRMPVPWEQKIENLSVGIQQRIEILKILRHQADILILDEPTAVLTPIEVQTFLEQLRDLRRQGKTVLLITHKLKEVIAMADDVTVIRRGHLIFSGTMAGQTPDSLSEKMMGRRLNPLPKRNKSITSAARSLQVTNLCYHQGAHDWLKDVSFQVNAGEIVGIAGIEGNGQSQLLDALIRPSFLRGQLSGKIQMHEQTTVDAGHGSDHRWEPRRIRQLSLGYFPEDRLQQALLLHESGTVNFLLGQQRSSEFQHRGFLRWQTIRKQALICLQQFQVRPDSLTIPLGQFSGGNQQKFVVGRELHRQPRLVIAAQPSRGVDIGAIEQIHSELLKRKNQGVAILVISSDLDELMQLSDRILVLSAGRLTAEFARAEFDEMRIGLAMSAAEAAP